MVMPRSRTQNLVRPNLASNPLLPITTRSVSPVAVRPFTVVRTVGTSTSPPPLPSPASHHSTRYVPAAGTVVLTIAVEVADAAVPRTGAVTVVMAVFVVSSTTAATRLPVSGWAGAADVISALTASSMRIPFWSPLSSRLFGTIRPNVQAVETAPCAVVCFTSVVAKGFDTLTGFMLAALSR